MLATIAVMDSTRAGAASNIKELSNIESLRSGDAGTATNVNLDGYAAAHDGGGGVVADSVPEAEYQETVNKAKALISAADEAVRYASAARKGQ